MKSFDVLAGFSRAASLHNPVKQSKLDQIDGLFDNISSNQYAELYHLLLSIKEIPVEVTLYGIRGILYISLRCLLASSKIIKL